MSGSAGVLSQSSASHVRIHREDGSAHPLDFESLASTNSGSGHERSDSEVQRQQRAALNLRKLRDSVVIRRTAAKLKHPDGGGSREDSVSERLLPLRPAALFAQENSGLRDEGEGGAEAARAAAGSARGEARARATALEESSLKTQSDETSPTAGQAHSLERHQAEFRHTLRKSVRREGATMSTLLPPTTLFGADQAFGKGQGARHDASNEECPICLEPTSGGHVHVTTCAHRFHLGCYNEYRRNALLATRDQCPVCRTSQRLDPGHDLPASGRESLPCAAYFDGVRRASAAHSTRRVTIESPEMLDGVALEGEQHHQEHEFDSGGAHPSLLAQHASRPFADTPLILESQVSDAQRWRETGRARAGGGTGWRGEREKRVWRGLLRASWVLWCVGSLPLA